MKHVNIGQRDGISDMFFLGYITLRSSKDCRPNATFNNVKWENIILTKNLKVRICDFYRKMGVIVYKICKLRICL